MLFVLIMYDYIENMTIYLAYATEVQKCHPKTSSAPLHATCPGQPCDEAYQSAFEFAKAVSDLSEILQNTDKALEKMVVTFTHMAYYMKSKKYISIVESNEYKAVDSVQTFFRLLAPYLEQADCSLLTKLVAASCCEKAIKRLDEYILCSSNVMLSKSDETLRLPLHDLTMVD